MVKFGKYFKGNLCRNLRARRGQFIFIADLRVSIAGRQRVFIDDLEASSVFIGEQKARESL